MGKGKDPKCNQASMGLMLDEAFVGEHPVLAKRVPQDIAARRSSRLLRTEGDLLAFETSPAVAGKDIRLQAAERMTGISGEPQAIEHTPNPAVEESFRSGSHPQVRRILIDLDSTLFPLSAAAAEKGVQHNPVTSTAWDDLGKAIEAEGCDDIEGFFRELHSDADLMIRAGVFRHAPQVIKILREQYGVEVHLHTNRDPASRQACEEWLLACGIEHDGLQIGFGNKLEYAQQEDIGIIFDDKPQTLLEFHEDGRDGISLDWGYLQQNIDTGREGAGNISLIAGWGHALDSVLKSMSSQIGQLQANLPAY